jgi:hypothetical protein
MVVARYRKLCVCVLTHTVIIKIFKGLCTTYCIVFGIVELFTGLVASEVSMHISRRAIRRDNSSSR